MRPVPPAYSDVFTLRVTLRHVHPPIWRTVRIPAHLSLGVVHETIQIAFGWTNSHLHEFRIGEMRFGMADVDEDLFLIDERAAPLGAVANSRSKFVYAYDFGDDWDHDVVVEHVDEVDLEILRCTGGARACPPEDCGGPPGYERLLQALSDRNDPEHARLKEWAPRRFDAEKFNLAAVNKKLAILSKRVVKWRR